MRLLGNIALATIKSLCPHDSYFLIIVATRNKTSVDTDVPNDRIIPFLEETLRELKANRGTETPESASPASEFGSSGELGGGL